MFFAYLPLQRFHPHVRAPLRLRSARPQRRLVYQLFGGTVYCDRFIELYTPKTFSDLLQNFIAHSSRIVLSVDPIRRSVGLSIHDRQRSKVGLFRAPLACFPRSLSAALPTKDTPDCHETRGQ